MCQSHSLHFLVSPLVNCVLQSHLGGPVVITAAGVRGNPGRSHTSWRWSWRCGRSYLQARAALGCRVTYTTMSATLSFTRVSTMGSEAFPAGKRQFTAILSPLVKTNRERRPWSLLTSTAGTTQAALFGERRDGGKKLQFLLPPCSAPSLLPWGCIVLLCPREARVSGSTAVIFRRTWPASTVVVALVSREKQTFLSLPFNVWKQ